MLFLYVRVVFLFAIGFVFIAGLALIFLSRKVAASNRISRFRASRYPQDENEEKEVNLLNIQLDPAVLN